MINRILERSLDSEDKKSLKILFSEKLVDAGLSKTQFERLANIQRRSLDGILDKTSKQTDVINLLKLGQFLDLTLEELMTLHFNERPIDEIRELQSSLDITFINKHFDIKTLTALGFLDKSLTIATLKERICTFFQLESIYDYDSEFADVLYSRSKRKFSDKMKDFWVKSSYKYFELVNNPNEYSRDDLKILIPKIKPYTQNVEKGLLTVFKALYNIGITIVFQPSLPKTQIRGATFIVNDKPCIVLTDLFKSYPTIWFALFHELHHVLFDLDQLMQSRYHLTGEPDLFLLQEDKANQFASDYLISEEKMRYIEPMIHNNHMVTRLAKELQIHPSIIYSQFQYRQHDIGNNYWAAFKEYFPNVELAKSKLNVSNWDADSLITAAENVRQLLTV